MEYILVSIWFHPKELVKIYAKQGIQPIKYTLICFPYKTYFPTWRVGSNFSPIGTFSPPYHIYQATVSKKEVFEL